MSAYKQVHELPQALRKSYFASLPEPQEWFLEELVLSGEIWENPGEGYAIFSGGTLVEFHTNYSDHAHLHLSSLIQQRPFRKGLAKSFDHVLIHAAKRLGWELKETGFLFRKRAPVVLDKIPDFRLEKATQADLPEAWNIGRDFYENEDEVERFYQSSGLWVGYEDGQMVGNGVMIPIDGSGSVFDVGMVTRPSRRNRGIASRIVAELADLLEGEDKRPICGCSESNLASKAALEKAGFVSEHRLVQITIPA